MCAPPAHCMPSHHPRLLGPLLPPPAACGWTQPGARWWCGARWSMMPPAGPARPTTRWWCTRMRWVGCGRGDAENWRSDIRLQAASGGNNSVCAAPPVQVLAVAGRCPCGPALTAPASVPTWLPARPPAPLASADDSHHDRRCRRLLPLGLPRQLPWQALLGLQLAGNTLLRACGAVGRGLQRRSQRPGDRLQGQSGGLQRTPGFSTPQCLPAGRLPTRPTRCLSRAFFLPTSPAPQASPTLWTSGSSCRSGVTWPRGRRGCPCTWM